MRLSTVLASSLALSAYAAPAYPNFDIKNAINPGDSFESLSEYFNLLATRVQLAKVLSSPPICDISKAVMPVAPVALPPPSPGLKVSHVAVGRGTQNYTCASNSASVKPEANGAVATLFNASCVAALYPDLLNRIPGMALRFDISDPAQLGASPLPVSGTHYFKDKKTPYFNLNTNKGNFGEAWAKKENDTPAPATAATGRKGEKAVAWLKLSTLEGTSGKIKEVYRVTTAGGSAPATCEGMPANFEVQYATVQVSLS